jgi:hypothetical protein
MTTMVSVWRGPCPKCGADALCEGSAVRPEERDGVVIRQAVHVECQSPGCDNFVPPPRRL